MLGGSPACGHLSTPSRQVEEGSGSGLTAHSAGAGATPPGTGQAQGRGQEGTSARRAQKEVLQMGSGQAGAGPAVEIFQAPERVMP